MEYLTLREICEQTGVSRRAIQGYEKAKLVSSVGRNGRGHLLYDKKSKERIQLIKLFQQLGFTIRDIQKIIDSPKDVLKAAIEARVDRLNEKKAEIDILIERAYRLIESMQ